MWSVWMETSGSTRVTGSALLWKSLVMWLELYLTTAGVHSQDGRETGRLQHSGSCYLLSALRTWRNSPLIGKR